MDPVQIGAVEVDEQLWHKWVQKGQLRDDARKRRCRIIGGVVGGILLLVIPILRSILPR
jgi:hypothetical protein